MSRGLVKTSRYSPGNMTGQALEQLFVGRDPLMKKVLKRLNASALGREKHFMLLVGPRGIGKTHFVSLAHHKLKSDPAYADVRAQLKVAYLNEEEWGVASFLDLLVRILESLRAEQKDSKLSEGIERIYEAFKKGPDAALQVAQSLLIEHVRGSNLLLVCENLSDLFEGLGEEGQKRWRAFIQEHPFWSILATTPALFSGVQLQSSPFYNFFSIEPLQRLDFDTAMELLRQRAAMDGQLRLVEFLSTPIGRARVRAIHHLAGGNHRVYVILSDFLDEESLEGLISPFMRMADDLTPYYQDRMRQLSPQQRKIVELLCKESKPVIVKNVAMRCLVSPQVAAKQLGELAKARFVLNTKVGREAYYELAEPLMRICVDIKDNRTEHFRLFVDFLRHWFSGRELRAKLDLLERSSESNQFVDKLHLAVALREFSLDAQEPFLENLDVEAKKCSENKDYQGVVDVMPRLLAERPNELNYRILSWAWAGLRRFEDSCEVAQQGVVQYPGSHALYFRLAVALAEINRANDALFAATRALEISPENVDYAYACCVFSSWSGRYEEAIEFGKKVLQAEPYRTRASIFVGNALRFLGRHAEAEQEYRKGLDASPGNQSVLRELFVCLVRQKRNSEAVALVESSPELIASEEFSFERYGHALVSLGQFEKAHAQFDKALEVDAGNGYAYVCKMSALLNQKRDKDVTALAKKALAACRDELTIGVVLDVLNILGEFLAVLDFASKQTNSVGSFGAFPEQCSRALIELHKYKEALDVLNEVRPETVTEPARLMMRVEALVGCEGFGTAMSALDEVFGLYPDVVDKDVGLVETSLGDALLTESQLRGAVAMARQVGHLQAVLEKHGRSSFLPGALTELLDAWLDTEQLVAGEWALAVQILQEVLANRIDCRIPVSMLSVAAKYAVDGDESVLLELPLEQRTLLLEKLGFEFD